MEGDRGGHHRPPARCGSTSQYPPPANSTSTKPHPLLTPPVSGRCRRSCHAARVEADCSARVEVDGVEVRRLEVALTRSECIAGDDPRIGIAADNRARTWRRGRSQQAKRTPMPPRSRAAIGSQPASAATSGKQPPTRRHRNGVRAPAHRSPHDECEQPTSNRPSAFTFACAWIDAVTGRLAYNATTAQLSRASRPRLGQPPDAGIVEQHTVHDRAA